MKGIREMGGRMMSETKDVTTAVKAEATLEESAMRRVDGERRNGGEG